MAVPGGSVPGGSIVGQIVLTDQTQAAVDSAIARAAQLDKRFESLQASVGKTGSGLKTFGTEAEQAAARVESSSRNAARGIGQIQLELIKAEQELGKLKTEVKSFDDTVGPGFKAATGAMLDDAILKAEKLRQEFAAAKKEISTPPAGGNFLKTMTGQLDGFASSARNVGLTATAAITLPLVAAGGAAIKLGMDAIESENLVSVSFGNMKGAADDWSKNLSKNLGLNEYELRKTAGTIFNMTSSMGVNRKAAFDMSTGVAMLAADMASFRNMSIDEALVKIRSGLVGETEPLKAIGILVDEATTKQEAYRIGIAKYGSELTQVQKVEARWSAILRQTANDQGDLARTIDSPANALRVLSQRIQNAGISFGMALMPAVEKAIGLMKNGVGVLESFVGWFAALPEPVQLAAVAVGAIVAVAPPALLVLGQMASGISAVIKMYQLLAGAQAAAAAASAASAATTATAVSTAAAASAAATGAAGAASAGFFGTIMTGLEAAGAAIVGFLGWPVIIGAAIAAAVGGILYHFGLLTPIKDFIVDLGTVVVGFSKMLVGEAVDAVKSWIGGIVDGIQWVGKMSYAVAEWAASMVGIDLDGAVKAVRDFAVSAYDWVSTKLDQAWEKAKSWAKSIRDTIHDVAESFRNSIPDVKAPPGFKSVAEQAADLRIKMIEMPTAANDARSSFAKLTDTLNEARQALKNLSNVDKKQLADLLKAGVDPSDISKATGLTSVAIELFKTQQQEAKKAGDAADKLKTKQEELSHSYLELSGAQIEAIRWYKDQNYSVAETAKQLGIYELQVRQAIDADKDAAKAQKDAEKAQKERTEHAQKAAKQLAELEKGPSEAILSNLKIQRAAEDERWKLTSEATMSGVDRQLAEIDRWVADEKAKLDSRAPNYAAAQKAIDDLANTKKDNARQADSIANGPFAKWYGPEMPTETAERIGKKFSNRLRDVIMTDVPDILQRAFEGGGGLWGAIQSLSARIGGMLKSSNWFAGMSESVSSKAASFLSFGSAKLGSALSGIFSGGLSAAIDVGMQLLAKGIKKLFGGPSEDELKGRDSNRRFEDSIIGTLTAQQKAEAGGERWKEIVIGVRDAYIAVGKTAEEAEAIVKRLWEAEKQGPEAVKAVQDEISAAVDKQKKLQQGASKFGLNQEELEQAAKDAKDVYDYMAASGKYSAKQIADAFKAAQEAADRAAGIDVDAQKKAEEATKSALDGLIKQRDDILQAIGQEAPEADMGVIEKQMREQAAALDAQIKQQQAAAEAAASSTAGVLDKAMEKNTGVVGPRAQEMMYQVIQQNEAANAAMDQSIDEHAKSQNEKIADSTKRAIDDLIAQFANLKIPTIYVDYRFRGDGLPGEKREAQPGEGDGTVFTGDSGWGEAQPASSGALATPAGLSYYARGGRVRWRKQGTDDIPAMLTAGERVLSVDQNKAFEAGVMMAKSPAGGNDETPMVANLYANLHIDGHAVTTAVIQNIKFDKRGAKKDARRALGV